MDFNAYHIMLESCPDNYVHISHSMSGMNAFLYAIIHQNPTTTKTMDAKFSTLTTMMKGPEETYTIVTM